MKRHVSALFCLQHRNLVFLFLTVENIPVRECSSSSYVSCIPIVYCACARDASVVIWQYMAVNLQRWKSVLSVQPTVQLRAGGIALAPGRLLIQHLGGVLVHAVVLLSLEGDGTTRHGALPWGGGIWNEISAKWNMALSIFFSYRRYWV